MRKEKYYFNTETLNYEKVDTSFKAKFKRALLHSFTGLFVGLIFFVVFVFTVESPSQKNLRRENKNIQSQYRILNKQYSQLEKILEDLQQRDDNLYRVVFQAEPIPLAVRKGGYGGTNRYDYIKDLTNAEIVFHTTKKATELQRQLYIQSKSFDEIVQLAKSNETRLENIPAIQPIFNKNLKRVASGFGWRIDPIYHVRKFHHGIDFTAPTGTKIFATGNGTVVYSGWKQGYGNCIIINHGFNYRSLYAHMYKYVKRRGDKVKRGEVIGFVGNTGKSTGPHLHYEVQFKGKAVNPMNYFFRDLSPSEYDKMLQFTNNNAQVFD